MFRSHTLQPQTIHEEPLAFEWDPDTGSLRGSGADTVRKLCAHAVSDGYVTGHPYPTPFDISDPLLRPAEMAVVLGQFWTLDETLAAEYPVIDEPFDPNDEIDSHITY